MYNERIIKRKGGFRPTKAKNIEGSATGSLQIWEEVEETRKGCRELNRGENRSTCEGKADGERYSQGVT